MSKHKHSLSIVIPAHNEESCIEDCILSLLGQNIVPDEIIVVVNASSDRTAEIAKRFKQVQVVEVTKKSITNARNIGFNLAKFDIIARLNADVTCPPDWSEKLLKNFINGDIAAVTGPAKTKTLPFITNSKSTFWSNMYLSLAEVYFGVVILWGANMAIRKTAWDVIKSRTCLEDTDAHEDQDISLHLMEQGLKIIKDKNLVVYTNETSYFNWDKFRVYNKLRVKTKKSHSYIYKLNTINKTPFIKRIYVLAICSLPAVVFYISSIVKSYLIKFYRVLVR